ncbi:histidine phosphatase family protein [Fundicoccus culcitae]|uniref:Histidine phosphatase family protein n=1 Tax=Fundicoccus culcitae TaxID=2969821 RepID=A0ABY5P3M6_9LACT|nr:histidine phosphatase family protein [Fundicoccus culcitae]UUX33339.1 histidine phosphatase family protein [Fundicoccus culcitae]
MNIFFVRHGETELNRLKKYYGITDVPLNLTGINQMKSLAIKLKKYKFDRIIVSGLQRTALSANVIINQNNIQNIKIETIDNYNERNFGTWEKLDADEIELLYPEVWKSFVNNPLNTNPLDAESYEDFQDRVNKEFIHLINSVNESDNILFIGHGGVIREIISSFFEKDIEYWDIKIESGMIYTYSI